MLSSAIALALVLHAAPAKVTIDGVVKKELAEACTKGKPGDYCKLLLGFSKGAVPKLPENRFFSIGPLFNKDGRKDIYVFFISDGVGKEQQAAAETLRRASDMGEAIAADDYRKSVASGKRDTKSKMHEYLSKRAPTFPLHPVKISEKSLTWQTASAGPNTTWVRQQGNHLIGVALRQRGEATELLVFEAPVD